MHPGKTDQQSGVMRLLAIAGTASHARQSDASRPASCLTTGLPRTDNKTKTPSAVALQPISYSSALLTLLNNAIDIGLIKTQRLVDDAIALDSVGPRPRLGESLTIDLASQVIDKGPLQD